MRYAKIRSRDISNGPGFRVSLFTQGCMNHCEGCFNKETWDLNGGYEWTEEKQNILLDLCDKDYIQGLSILGGEPFLHFKEDRGCLGLLNLLCKFKERFPKKDVWVWTGYELEDIIIFGGATALALLRHIDVIVDGPFIQSEKELGLKYRGSKNQRVIDVKKTLDNLNHDELIIVPYEYE